MSKRMALLFSLMGISALCGVSIALSFANGWLALLCALAFLAVTAVGFIYKARLRRRAEQQTDSSLK